MYRLLNREKKRCLDEEFSSTLKKTLQTPQERYDMPQTTQQEIGWFKDPITSKSSIFYRPSVKCDETKFAEELIRSNAVDRRRKEAS